MSGDRVLKIQRLPHAQGLELPSYQTEGSAGMDLRAAVDEPITLSPGERELVPTGLVVEIPAGHEGQVRTRSGLAVHDGLAALNSPGTVDADYRGEIRVILINLGSEPVTIARGDRIAQLVVTPVTRVRVEEVAETAPTERGAGGFGSTGID